jgi:anaerobic dimethyl sulfoxide reductase subunit C (anchor subunit)
MSGNRPWSLVFFTVLTQMAVGALAALVAFGLLLRGQTGQQALPGLASVGLSTVGLTLAGAVVAASFHLGRPGRAPHVVRNVRSSWLSREVVLGVVFGLAFVTYAALCSFGLGSPPARDLLGVAAALVGMALVGAMSRIYMLRTVPAWNAAATPIFFFTTTLLLGTLALGTQLAVVGAYGGGAMDRNLVDAVVGSLSLLGAALVAVALVTTVLHGRRLRRLGGAAAESFHIVFHAHRQVLVLRSVLAVVGAALFGLFALWSFAGVAMLGFVLVLCGEILGRLLFFASHRRLGL